MPTRRSEAFWEGDLKSGQGTMKLGSGALQVPYSFGTRFEEVPGTNPEELIGAAHAGCFSMALSLLLAQSGHPPRQIHTTAAVSLEKVGDGFKITRIRLHCEATVPGMTEQAFRDAAEKAKTGCPVSQALAAVPIELETRFMA